MGDTLNAESDFVKIFMQHFIRRTASLNEIFLPVLLIAFWMIFSADSATHAKAQASISNIYYTKNDIPKLVNTINRLKYGDKEYLDSKSRFIAELGYITDTTVTATIVNALKDIYYKTADTSTFQNMVLKALAKNKTRQSYTLLKELILQDPPVFATNYEYSSFSPT